MGLHRRKFADESITLKVITGGQYDVDVELISPTKEIVYRQIKSQFDSHQFTAPVS